MKPQMPKQSTPHGSAPIGGGTVPITASRTDDHEPPLRDVAGKVAFITGGSSGIGLGMGRVFSAAGMKVIFTYRQKEHYHRAMSCFQGSASEVHAIQVDVSDRAGMEQAAQEAQQVFGPVHLLCNNAGIGMPRPIGRTSYEDWDWAINVNVTGVFNGIHAFLPGMRSHGQGAHILSTASAGGLVAGALGVYSTTKFAVVGMMESLRAELEAEGIGVSVFCPGLIRSDIHDWARNRPKSISHGEEASPESNAQHAIGDQLTAVAMDPIEAAQYVLAGIRQNDLYILSHAEFAEAIQERCDAMLASLAGDAAPSDRVAVVRTYLLSDIYSRERDRLRARQAKRV